MIELAMHILDIVENSVRALASLIIIQIEEDSKEDRMTIVIQDNGKGMDEEMLNNVLDPFITTKSNKKVGLGLSLLSEAAKKTGGDMTIESTLGEGTRVEATFVRSHIDRQPMGDLIETFVSLVVGNPDVHFQIERVEDGEENYWHTGMIVDKFGEDNRYDPEVFRYIKSGLTFLKTLT